MQATEAPHSLHSQATTLPSIRNMCLSGLYLLTLLGGDRACADESYCSSKGEVEGWELRLPKPPREAGQPGEVVRQTSTMKDSSGVIHLSSSTHMSISISISIFISLYPHREGPYGIGTALVISIYPDFSISLSLPIISAHSPMSFIKAATFSSLLRSIGS